MLTIVLARSGNWKGNIFHLFGGMVVFLVLWPNAVFLLIWGGYPTTIFVTLFLFFWKNWVEHAPKCRCVCVCGSSKLIKTTILYSVSQRSGYPSMPRRFLLMYHSTNHLLDLYLSPPPRKHAYVCTRVVEYKSCLELEFLESPRFLHFFTETCTPRFQYIRWVVVIFAPFVSVLSSY